eukprot:scaffold72872_cov18-Tisochrysis_lutea.AAC.1
MTWKDHVLVAPSNRPRPAHCTTKVHIILSDAGGSQKQGQDCPCNFWPHPAASIKNRMLGAPFDRPRSGSNPGPSALAPLCAAQCSINMTLRWACMHVANMACMSGTGRYAQANDGGLDPVAHRFCWQHLNACTTLPAALHVKGTHRWNDIVDCGVKHTSSS